MFNNHSPELILENESLLPKIVCNFLCIYTRLCLQLCYYKGNYNLKITFLLQVGRLILSKICIKACE